MLEIITFATIRKKSAYCSKCLRKYFAKFSDLVGTWVGMINLTFVLRWFKGRFYGNQLILGFIRRRRYEPCILIVPTFDNGLDDCEATFKRLKGNNSATSCRNLVQ